MMVSKELDAAKDAFRSAVVTMDEVFRAVRVRGAVSITVVQKAVKALIEHLEISDALLVPFLNTDGQRLGLSEEAVDVGVLALRIGMELDYSDDDLGRLGLAALLRDIGRATAPAKSDRSQLARGLEEALQLLQGLPPSARGVTEVIRRVQAAQNGAEPASGGEAWVREHASIVELAGTCLRLVQKRSRGPRAWPPEALKDVLQQERARFPDRILKVLIRVLATLPVGGLVRLNSGEIGQVTAKNEGFPLRPVVAILVRRGKRLREPKQIDLKESPFLHVKEFLEEGVLDSEVEGAE